jgi:hypothetical protein
MAAAHLLGAEGHAGLANQLRQLHVKAREDGERNPEIRV